jgi:chromosome segregation ATPase
MTDTIEIRSRLEDEADRLATENLRLLARVQGQEEEIVKLMAWNERLVDENGKLLVRLTALEGVAEDMERLWGRYEKLEVEKAALHRRIEELEAVLTRIDAIAPAADDTCLEPGITLSEAVWRAMREEEENET